MSLTILTDFVFLSRHLSLSGKDHRRRLPFMNVNWREKKKKRRKKKEKKIATVALQREIAGSSYERQVCLWGREVATAFTDLILSTVLAQWAPWVPQPCLSLRAARGPGDQWEHIIQLSSFPYVCYDFSPHFHSDKETVLPKALYQFNWRERWEIDGGEGRVTRWGKEACKSWSPKWVHFYNIQSQNVFGPK